MVLGYDERGLLVELTIRSADGGGTIRYEYGPAEIAAPENAVPAPVPIPFSVPGGMAIPELP
jgi:hypothetical protein